MKAGKQTHIRVTRTYQAKGEGWVKAGRIARVGAKADPGLLLVSATRANQLVQRRLAEYVDQGEEIVDLPTTSRNDPVVQKEDAAKLAARAAGKQERAAMRATAPDHRKKVETPDRKNPLPKRKRDPAPPPPPSENAAETPETTPKRGRGRPRKDSQAGPAAPATTSSPPGGPTGPNASSPSSSAAGRQTVASVSTPRGIRRGTSASSPKSAGSQSIKVGSSSPGPTDSTEPTGPGGE